jgi:hypothetical protein
VRTRETQKLQKILLKKNRLKRHPDLAVEAAVAAALGALAGEVSLFSALETLGRGVAALALKWKQYLINMFGKYLRTGF